MKIIFAIAAALAAVAAVPTTATAQPQERNVVRERTTVRPHQERVVVRERSYVRHDRRWRDDGRQTRCWWRGGRGHRERICRTSYRRY